MIYDEFRDRKKINEISKKINEISSKKVRLMEVCGGHTMAIHKFGLLSMISKNITLISGPGCPVCVTSRSYIDRAIAYSKLKDVIVTTFGDLMRVPGSRSSLMESKASGADIQIVYSPLQNIKIAKENPNKKIIFLSIGFETTSPASALTIKKALEQGIKNFFIQSSHKIMPPALQALIDEGVRVDGYIAPGHVSTIIGSKVYEFIPKKYKIPVVVSGFEPLDLMQTVYMLIKQIEEGHSKVEIQYKRVVKKEGNLKAQKLLNEIFRLDNEWWRGLGVIPKSGYKLRKKYKKFDAEEGIKVEVEKTIEPKGCICGQILKGVSSPKNCPLFSKVCNPSSPVGPCMVSNEGACAAFYRYSD